MNTGRTGEKEYLRKKGVKEFLRGMTKQFHSKRIYKQSRLLLFFLLFLARSLGSTFTKKVIFFFMDIELRKEKTARKILYHVTFWCV